MIKKFDNPDRARRYAKTVASDIKVYNMKILEKALMEDNVFEVLEEQINEARDTYRSKVTDEIFDMNILDRVLVDVLLYEMRNVKSPIW
ncbi:hypothetical protein KKF34_12685 [Myxococcota bacterium]|nr:hypothetical protein [Myxococcota bacterium]MBU1379535.1 hypothetical protein [Myxococcota bacterium]MBU1497722.1 hypothetical protein [Myxococcota bacterium]